MKSTENELARNEGKSAASFCRQVAAWVPDRSCNFYFVKNHKNSTIPKASEKLSTDLESLEFQKKNFDACLTKFKNNQI